MTRSPSRQKWPICLCSEHVLAAHRARLVQPGARVSYDLLGEIDEHPVCPGLLLVTLPRRHALDLIHPPPRRTCAVAKPLDSLQLQRFGQTADQACDDADHIPNKVLSVG